MDDYAVDFSEKYSCALLADAAYRAGVNFGVAPAGLAPLEPDWQAAGPCLPVQANNDLVSVLAALHQARLGDILLIADKARQAAMIGDLIASEAARKGLAAIVVDGYVRDAAALRTIGVPVFCRGLIPIGPLKLPAKDKGIGVVGGAINLGETSCQAGDWVFADADGLIIVGATDLAPLFAAAARAYAREERLTAQIGAGTPLAELMGLAAFLAKRAADPAADFNEHVAGLGKAI